MTISGYSSELVFFKGFPRGFPFGGRCQNLLSYWVCEILKKFKSHLPHMENEKSHRLLACGFFRFRHADACLETRVQSRKPTGRLAQSVRREKGPPDLFLFPPHPIFRTLWSFFRSCGRGTWNPRLNTRDQISER